MKRIILGKSYIPLLIITLVIAVIGLNCVDIPSTGPTLPEMKAQFRFLNAADDITNDANEPVSLEIQVDDNSIGSVNFKETTGFLEFNAGSRIVYLPATDDTLRVAFGAQKRGTVVVLPRPEGSLARNVIRTYSRRIFDSAEVDTGMIKLAFASTAATDGVNLTVGTAETTLHTAVLNFGEETGYLEVPFGDYTIAATAVGDTTNTIIATTQVTANNRRKTSIILGADVANLSIVNLNDD